MVPCFETAHLVRLSMLPLEAVGPPSPMERAHVGSQICQIQMHNGRILTVKCDSTAFILENWLCAWVVTTMWWQIASLILIAYPSSAQKVPGTIGGLRHVDTLVSNVSRQCLGGLARKLSAFHNSVSVVSLQA